MRFSLIIATYGRSSEIVRLFESLQAQTHRDFEVIVVDQNEDGRVRDVCARFCDCFELHYHRSEKGVARARNVGLSQAGGEAVAFPDDDCWYQPDTLARVVAHLQENSKLSGVTGCSVDHNGRLSQGRWHAKPIQVDRYNIWTTATCYTIFLRMRAVRDADQFDPTLGVGSGSRWGSGEEVHYLLGVLAAGHMVHYDPQLRISHPEPLLRFDEKALRRGRLYNRGFGRVLSLNHYSLGFVAYHVGRPAAGCAISLLRGDVARARYYWIAATQRLMGWADRS